MDHELGHDHPDPDTTDLVELLLYEAQNNQMIDNHYLYAGALMLRAAAEIETMRKKLECA